MMPLAQVCPDGHVASRPAWYIAYCPYGPKCTQGDELRCTTSTAMTVRDGAGARTRAKSCGELRGSSRLPGGFDVAPPQVSVRANPRCSPAEAAMNPPPPLVDSAARRFSPAEGAGPSTAHLVKVTRKEGNMHPSSDRSEILETDREGPQVWSGRPTVSDRSTPTSG
jgi:hypothetical protein